MVHFPVYPASDHYHSHTRTFHNNVPHSVASRGVLRELWRLMIYEKRFHPPCPLPVMNPDWHMFFASSNKVRGIWLGHSSLLLRVGGRTLLFDPVYASTLSPLGVMMHRFQAPPIALNALPPIDIVVYSHAHYDHLDANVVRHFVQSQPDIHFCTPLGVGAYLKHWGVSANKIQECDWYQTVNLYDKFTLHAVPAYHHASRTLWDAKKSLWSGWVVETAQEKIYFSGDCAYQYDLFHDLYQHFGGFTLALIENGQYNHCWPNNHMFPEQSIQAALDVGAHCWMPIHWGAYPLSTHAWDESVCKSSALSVARQLPMLTPMLGQVFDRDTSTMRWWEYL